MSPPDQEVPAILSNVFATLRAIGEAGPAGAEVGAIIARTGLNVRTTYRHLSSLRTLGMVSTASERTRYRLGPAMAGLAQRTVDQREFMRRAQLFCDEITERSGETVHVTVCDQGTTVTVAAASRPTIGGGDSPPIIPGSRRPLHVSASGKAFLAYNPSAFEAYSVRKLERFTEHTIVDIRVLEQHCLRIRQRGYSEDRQEYDLNVTCVAVPVLGATGRAVGALAISTNSPTMSVARREELLQALRPAAKEFSQAIGGDTGA